MRVQHRATIVPGSGSAIGDEAAFISGACIEVDGARCV